MIYDDLKNLIDEAKDDYKNKVIRVEVLNNKKEELEKKLSLINVDIHSKATLALQGLARSQREKAKERLEELGTKALQYSMGANYKMIIEIDNTRKRPQATVKLLNVETGSITDPMKQNGGGVIDVISIALRLITLHSNSDPVVDGPIILDEPFKMVSSDYIPELARFLDNIATDFNRQIIMVTHNDYLAECCSKVITITK